MAEYFCKHLLQTFAFKELTYEEYSENIAENLIRCRGEPQKVLLELF